MKINGIPEWASLHSIQQCAAASKVMTAWPTMAELLDGLAACALKQAKELAPKPVVLKDKGRWSETMFSRQLHSHLSKYSWQKQDGLFATIATIANMAVKTGYLKTKDEEIAAKFVRRAIEGSPIKGAQLSVFKGAV